MLLGTTHNKGAEAVKPWIASFGSVRQAAHCCRLGRTMGILSRLFGSKSEVSARPAEHAVIVTFTYIGSTDLDPLFAGVAAGVGHQRCPGR